MIALWLSVVSSARAATWWVADERDALALEEALGDVWPGHPVHVVVGPVDGTDLVRLYVVDGILVLETPEGPPRQAPVDDWWTRAALARSWLRETGVAAALPRPHPARFRRRRRPPGLASRRGLP